MHLAAQHHLPVYPIYRLRDAQTIATLTAVRPDLICVSCFDQIFPPALLQIPSFGCLNVHPSLLPQFRGPFPLFWTFREGQNKTGVTVHFMDEGIDTGDIALQASLTLPAGISGAQAEQICAERGGRLLLAAIKQAAAGNLTRQPQMGASSYQTTPTDDEFRLHTEWSAQRAFNFMRGTAEWKRPYPLHVAGKAVRLQTAVAVQPEQTLPELIRWQGDTVSVQFNPGVLIARIGNYF